MTKHADRAFFSSWTPEMAYVFGFWFADGSMTQPGKDCYVSFVTKDLAHLQLIRDVMRSEQRIYARPDGCYALYIGSKQMWHDLLRLGGRPAKSLVADMPFVPSHFVRHFARGYVDGDGWLYWDAVQRRRPVIGIVGGHRFLESLGRVLDEETGVEVATVKIYTDKTPYIVYTGIKAKALSKWLYAKTDLALERKAVLAREFATWELSKFGWKSREVMIPKMRRILEM